MNLSQRLANLSPKQRELLQQRLRQSPQAAEPIAIVGMACRFPGAPDLDAYWRLISEGRDGTSEIPPERWDVDALYDPTGTVSGKMSVRRAGLVDGIDRFDPKFFGISPREAARMDPQQRMLLEVSWEALEVGGIAADQIAGTPVGVYVGIGGTDYSKLPSQYEGYYQYIDAHVGTGNALSIAANRISYIFDLRGPSMAIDTACSSSTMAIHTAIGNLRNRQCDLALAGGVNAILTPETTIAFSKARMLSPDGRCRPFDASANGYVRGEGCGMLVLKRLSDAAADGDHVLGIVRASATNQDGRTSGITAPNGVSQQAVIREALSQAGLKPSQIDYIEAHGTGTPLGDPIEVDALTQVFKQTSASATSQRGPVKTEKPVYVTSVKANVGHMETVSGVAGIIKVLLMMQHRMIPSQSHLEKLNPRISLKGSRLVIPDKPQPWPVDQPGRPEGPFFAGVSSFGFGGANTHLILQSPTESDTSTHPVDARAGAKGAGSKGAESKGTEPADSSPANEQPSSGTAPAASPPPVADRHRHVVAVSGKSDAAVGRIASRLADHLKEHPDLDLADVAHTLAVGRVHLTHRAAMVTESLSQLQDQLAAVAAGKADPTVQRGVTAGSRAPRVAMLFTGQGSQQINMGRQLLDSQPVFRDAMIQCDQILADSLPRRLLSVIYPDWQPPAGAIQETPETTAPRRPNQPKASVNGHAQTLPKTNGQDEAAIDQTQYTQPALFAVEYALAKLWQSWGIQPAMVLGHSVGEYVAMCIAGCLSLEDALGLLARRASLMQQLPAGGKMAAVFASADKVESIFDSLGDQAEISIAASNGPENTVVSGAGPVVDRFVKSCEAAGIKSQPLKVSHAFHSPLMEPMLDEFRQHAQRCEFRRPRIKLIANLTGELLQRAPDPDMLCRHIRQRVRFAESIQTLAESDIDVVLEAGPAPVLIGMGRRCVASDSSITWMPSLRPKMDDEAVLLDSLARLETQGVELDWKAFDRPWRRRRLMLPTYPFQRERFWLDPSSSIRGDASDRRVAGGRQKGDSHPLLGTTTPTAAAAAQFDNLLSTNTLPFLADHSVQGSINMPAAGFLELTLAAAARRFGQDTEMSRQRLVDLSIGQAMFLPPPGGDQGTETGGDEPVEKSRWVQTVVSEARTVEVFSTSADRAAAASANPTWKRHCHARLALEDAGEAPRPGQQPLLPPESYGTVSQRILDAQPRDDFYQIMLERRLQYGPNFQMLQRLDRCDGEARAVVSCTEEVVGQVGRFRLHPVLGDALFQTMSGLIPPEPDGTYSPFTYMPVGVGSVRLVKPVTPEMVQKGLFTYGLRTSDETDPSPESVRGDLWLVDSDGEVVAELLDVRVQRIGRAGSDSESSISRVAYALQWKPIDPEIVSSESASSPWADQRVLLLAGEPGSASFTYAEELARALVDQSAHPILASERADADEPPTAIDRRTLNPDEPEQLTELLRELTTDKPLAAILDTRVLDAAAVNEESSDAELLFGSVTDRCDRVMRLCQAAGKTVQPADSPSWRGIWTLTCGAVARSTDDPPVRLAQSPAWGMVRVAMLEFTELRPGIMDLDPAQHDAGAAVLDALAALGEKENQMLVRQGQWSVARLEPVEEGDLDGQSAVGPASLPKPPYRLRFRSEGSFDSLYYEPMSLSAPTGDQVQLRVHAAGLNFSDVLKAMGLYPGITDAVVPLGIECSGRVTAVGPEVSDFEVGDEVMGVAPFSFGSHATTPQYTLIRRPDSVDPVDAASVPIAFLTAWHALARLADVQPGERVLIHAGAGGVGLAAIQIAKYLGAEIFATAGSTTKRDFIREAGADHVFNSRTTQFADQIRDVTGGEGIDVVLNSLPGEAIDKSLSILRAYGRFLEIGKTDIYQNRPIGLAPFQDNLSYHAIDLDRVLRQRPQVIRKLFAELSERFAAGDLHPSALTSFEATEIVDAFRYMAQRKNIGKIVVRMSAGEVTDEASSRLPESSAGTDSDETKSAGTVLITGGTGALGLQIAADLVKQGTTHIALLARRQPAVESQAEIDRLNRDAKVVVLRGDVSDSAALSAALQSLPDHFPAMDTVMHAAGVLDDGLMIDMTGDQLRRPLGPKVAGTWNLHLATRQMGIRRFVLFSSIAGTLGSPGQANYAAANRFLDAFAQYRRSLGLPATSIAWGPWGGTGMAAGDQRGGQMETRGMRLIDPASGLQWLHQIVDRQPVTLTVMDVDWPKMLANVRGPQPLLSAFASDDASDGANDRTDHAFLKQCSTLSDEALTQRLQAYFSEELARLMGWPVEQIVVSQPLSELGMDSLIAMELKSSLEQKLDVQIPMAALVESPSIGSLVASVQPMIGGESSDSPAPYNPLMSLKPSGSKQPWICVHPLGGSLSCYAELAEQADQDRPVLGLLGRGSDGSLAPPPTMDEMLAEYVHQINARVPEGPVHLIGWSAGGIFALELARRLADNGRQIGLLAILDTPLPSIYDNVDPADPVGFLVDFVNFSNVFLNAEMDITEEQLRQLQPGEMWQQVLAEAQRNHLLPAGATSELVQRLVHTSATHVSFIKHYQLQPPYPTFQLIRPRDTEVLQDISRQDWATSLQWRKWVDGVTVHETGGNHFEMLLGPHAATLSRQLESLCPEEPVQAAVGSGNG